MTRFRLSALGLFLTACLLVAYLSLAPGGTIPHSNQIDKVLHVLGYAGLVWLGGLAFTSWRLRGALTVALLGYGGFLEIVQQGLPQHQASLLDMAANAGGLVAGLIAVAVSDAALRVAAHRRDDVLTPRADPAER